MAKDIPVKETSGTVPVNTGSQHFGKTVTAPSAFRVYSVDDEFREAEIIRMKRELREAVYGKPELTELTEKKKKVRGKSYGVPVLLAILSLITLAFLVVGNFFTIESMSTLFVVSGGKDAIALITEFFSDVSGGFDVMAAVPVIAVALVCLFSVLSVIGNFASVKKGTGGLMKTGLTLQFVLAVVVAVLILVDKAKIPVGLYVTLGLTFVTMFLSFFGKQRKQRNKAKKG